MILSLDVGATKIGMGLVKNNRLLFYQKFFWSKPLTKQRIIDKVIEVIEKGPQPVKNYSALTIGIAGQIDKKGRVKLSHNFLKEPVKIHLRKIFKDKFHLPVYLDNDARCFTLAEAIFGQGKKYHSVVGLTLGTGIGGGLVVNKKIHLGPDLLSGEFGHQIIAVGGRFCSCGRRGCWEAYASGTALSHFYFEITGQRKDALEIERLFLQKQTEAELAVNETGCYLALGLANIVNTINPEVIVLGGGLIRFKDFIRIALKKFPPWLLVKETKTKIFSSSLGDKAGVLGAALLSSQLR